MKHLSILIKKIEQSLRINPRNAPLLETGLMILVISYAVVVLGNGHKEEVRAHNQGKCATCMIEEKEDHE